MRNFISFYSFCNYRCIFKLTAPKNKNLSPFIYIHLFRDLHSLFRLFHSFSFQKFVSSSIQDFMQNHTHAALFTPVSGVVGGVGKAISAKPLLLAITLPGLTTVIIYASESAVDGYVV